MSFGFLNLLMLAGMAGVALPVLAHLLSKRKFDVVQWGAMQFLELGRRTRRRIRLEEWMLLLLRMGLIALIVLALARPWAKGGVFSQLTNTAGRDVVFVIDGSYSMGWEGKSVTPHAAAIDWVHDYLENLHPGDTVAVLDARDQVRAVIDPPTSDFRHVREQLARLPLPAGTSNLAAAAGKAVQILSRTTNVAREVIILTDNQALPWNPQDEHLWARFDDLRAQPAVPPRVWAINVAGEDVKDRTNYSVDRIQLSRELTVPDFPIRIETRVRQSGGSGTRRKVYFAIDGQRLDDQTQTVNLPPDGEAAVKFEHRFPSVGSYVISVMLDVDNLPGDNRADAAVVVAAAVPVLLVDGDPQLDPVRRETFFAKAALSASNNKSPWVQASVVDWQKFSRESLDGQAVAFLANVPRLSDAQAAALKDFVARGGGLVIAPGDKVDPAAYVESLDDSGDGLLPARLERVDTDAGYELGTINVSDESLDVPWLARFRKDSGVDFTDARFGQWWKLVVPAAAAAPAASPLPAAGSAPMAPPPAAGNTNAAAATPPPAAPLPATSIPSQPVASPALIAARLDNHDPFLVTRSYGLGSVLLLATPLDTDWSTLPAKNDFVPFLHEIVFLLASRTSGRNVDAGMPLVFSGGPQAQADQYLFIAPDGTELAAEATGDELQPRIRLSQTQLPGLYRAVRKADRAAPAEQFVVNFDHSESDLAALSPVDRTALSEKDRLTFIETVEQLVTANQTDEARTEAWRLLLLAVLGLLVFEVAMTRRLVRGGHEAVDEDSAMPLAAVNTR